MLRDRKMHNATAFMCQEEEDIENLKPDRRNRKKSAETMSFRWFSRNVLRLCEGDPLCRTKYLLTSIR
jgi:hypothetical protein